MRKLLLIALLAVSVTGCKDEPDPQEQQYCAMVSLWQEQAVMGVPADERIGWPPFNGECK
jgi:hypothetical protein